MNRRAIAITAAVLFVLSWIFPVGAGLVRNPTSLPKWWGTVDVALAFVVAVGALFLYLLPWWLVAAARPEIADPMRNSSRKIEH